MTTGLFLQNLLHAVTIFDKKTNRIFYITIGSIILCYLEAIFVVINLVLPIQIAIKYILQIFVNIYWFFLIQGVTFLYILRIKSLGEYMSFDKHLYTIPWIVAAVQIPSIVINLLKIDDINATREQKYDYFVISRSLYTIVITAVDILLYVFLLKKLKFIMEYRQDVVRKLGWHLKVAMILVTFLEIGLAVIRILFPIDYTLTPIIYLLRIYIIIQFYGDLINSVKTSSNSADSLLKSQV